MVCIHKWSLWEVASRIGSGTTGIMFTVQLIAMTSQVRLLWVCSRDRGAKTVIHLNARGQNLICLSKLLGKRLRCLESRESGQRRQVWSSRSRLWLHHSKLYSSILTSQSRLQVQSTCTVASWGTEGLVAVESLLRKESLKSLSIWERRLFWRTKSWDRASLYITINRRFTSGKIAHMVVLLVQDP